MNGENVKLRTMEDYFPKELVDRFSEMTESEMGEILLSLKDSKYWTAIMKYIFLRKSIAQDGLNTLDPFKEPTQMARYQGIITGILDLPEGIAVIEDRAKKSGQVNE